MPITIGDGLAFCGRTLTEAELGMIRGITREFANLAWTELAATICELLEWRRPNGRPNGLPHISQRSPTTPWKLFT